MKNVSFKIKISGELKKSLAQQGRFIEYEGTQFKPFKASVASEVSGKIEPNKHDTLSILTMAIEAESKAHERYRKMAEETTDPKGKAMFQKLAEEETLHRRILSDEFYKLNNKAAIWSWGD